MTDDINYVSVDIPKEFADLVEAEYDNGLTIGEVVQWLWKRGFIDQRAARNALIRDFYYQQLHNQTATDARLDCAVNFNVTEKTVQRIIYTKG